MKTDRHINKCPRCGSAMKVSDCDGGMGSFPSVYIYCSTKGCYWGMSVSYDELSGETTAEDLLDKMIDQWNETLDNMGE